MFLKTSVTFISNDESFEAISLKGIFNITHNSYQRILKNNQDISKKNKKLVKNNFEIEYSEKFISSFIANENIRIYLYNSTFDKEIRNNMIECIYKINKIEEIEKDVLKTNINEKINSFYPQLVEKVSIILNVDYYNYFYDPEEQLLEEDRDI